LGFDLLLLYNLFVTFAPVLFTGYNPKASLACKNWMQLLKKWLFSDVFRRQSWVMVMIMKSTEDFVRSMRSLIPHEAEAFFSALEEDAPVSIRLNPTKFRRNPLCFSPEMVAQTVPWSQWGYYLSERPSFTFDPLFHAGYYYVQEASSMFLEYVVRQLVHEPVMCLDLCAAPGGKSAILLSSLPEGSLVVSNEIVRQRACVLSENLIKLGQFNAAVCNNAPADFAAFPRFFDLVLVDAPCSGEGMFRKSENAVAEWSLKNVEMCASRQRNILTDVWDALKPGGLLIYSTCTYNVYENEENVRWIADELGAECVSFPVDESWGISPALLSGVEAYRFFPHKVKGEGLFVAVLRKSASTKRGTINNSFRQKNKNRGISFLNDIAEYVSLLQNPDDFCFVENRGRITALPRTHVEILLTLAQKLRVMSLGIDIGNKKGCDFIPTHALAMSTQLNPDAFCRQEVSYEQAIAYLRGETIALDRLPLGFVLIAYKNEPLGFVKNLGNRTNNLYPREWRIRSSHLPEKREEPFGMVIEDSTKNPIP